MWQTLYIFVLKLRTYTKIYYIYVYFKQRKYKSSEEYDNYAYIQVYIHVTTYVRVT